MGARLTKRLNIQLAVDIVTKKIAQHAAHVGRVLLQCLNRPERMSHSYVSLKEDACIALHWLAQQRRVQCHGFEFDLNAHSGTQVESSTPMELSAVVAAMALKSTDSALQREGVQRLLTCIDAAHIVHWVKRDAPVDALQTVVNAVNGAAETFEEDETIQLTAAKILTLISTVLAARETLERFKAVEP